MAASIQRIATEVGHIIGRDLFATGQVVGEAIVCRDGKGRRQVIVGYGSPYIVRSVIEGKGPITWGPNGQAGKGRLVAFWEEGAIVIE